MYQVSEAFIQKTKNESQEWFVRGTVGNTPFDVDNVLEGSLTVANRCSDTADLTLGAVYTGELSCTFTGMPISRTNWQNQDITLEFGLLVDGVVEWVPFGIYRIAEANHSAAGVDVTAYDNMRLLDKKFSVTDLTISQPLVMLEYICRGCGVELGTDDLTGFANQGKYLNLYSSNDIETYRDLLYWVCQTIGAFATIDRTGKLVVRRFISDPIDTLNDDTRYTDCTFSDYATHYTGVSFVDIEAGKTRYSGAEVDDGTVINLGSNPFMQNDKALVQDILTEVQRIAYVPFTTKLLGGPHYDLGDIITHTDGVAGTESVCCVMAYEYMYGRSYEMQGVGANPVLATGKSKSDKNIQGLLSQIQEDAWIVHFFENSEDIEVNDGSTLVIVEIAYGTVKDTTISFSAEIQLDVECVEDAEEGISDAVATITYNNNGTDLVCTPTETYFDGLHILHLIQKVAVDGNTVGYFTVSLTASGGNFVIPAGCGKAWLEGTGLAAEAQWDGILRITDSYTPTELLEDIEVQGYTDRMTDTDYVPVGGTFTEQIPDMPLLEDVGVYGYTDSITSYMGAMYNADNMVYGTDVYVDDDNNLVTDSSTAEITTPVLVVNSITSISVVDNNATYLVSFDGGTTYMVYDGTDWIESSASSMTKAVIEAVDTFPAITTGVVVKVIITDTSSVKYIWIL